METRAAFNANRVEQDAQAEAEDVVSVVSMACRCAGSVLVRRQGHALYL